MSRSSARTAPAAALRAALAALALLSACKGAPNPTPVSKPDAPAQLTATAGDGQIQLQWQAAARAVFYTVRRAPASAGPFDQLGVTTATTFTDSGLPAGTAFFYTVRASNSAGDSADSAPATATTPGTAPAPPPAPSGLTATGGDAQISLTWTAVAGATGYRVLRAAQTGGPYAELATPAVPSYLDTGLAAGARFFYVVQAVNAAGHGASSSEASAVTNPALTVPAAPASLTATGGAAKVSLAWPAAAGAAGYLVLRSATSGSEAAPAIGTPSATSFDDTTAADGTRYFYVVKATNGAGTSAASPEASALTLPAKPAGFTATGGQGSIGLAWTAVASATKYEVFRGATAAAIDTTQPPLSSPTGALYTDTGLADGATFFYAVRAVNATGPGPLSDPQSAATNPPATQAPAAPAQPTAVGGVRSVTLTWPAAARAASYQVFRGTSAGGEGAAPVGTPAAPSFSDSGLADGTTYFYVVKAVNGVGTSAASPEASALTAPAAPAGLALTPGQQSIALSWTAAPTATRYELLRAAATPINPAATPLATNVLTTGYTDAGLADSATWCYAVRAVNAGGTGALGDAVCATTNPPATSPPAAPASFAAAGGVRSIVLTWAPATGAADYLLQRGTTAGSHPDFPAPGKVVLPSACTSTTCTFADDGGGSGLADGAGPYFYVLQARNSIGTSPATVEKSAVVLAAVPAGLAATAPDGVARTIQLQWSAATGAASSGNAYAILRLNAGTGAFDPLQSVTAAACAAAVCTFTDAPAADATAFSYQVESLNGAGVPSAPSSTATATTVPAAPVATAAARDGVQGTIDVSWLAVTGAVSYKLWRDAGASPSGAPTATPAASPFGDVSPALGDHQAHQYVVAAIDASGKRSPFSAVASATTAPAAPALTAAGTDGVNGSIDLGWPAVAGAASYTLTAGSGASARTVYSGAYPASLPLHDTGGAGPALGDHASVSYQVVATDGNGIHSPSAAASGTTAPGKPVPTATPQSGVAGTVSLAWSATSGAASYQVKRVSPTAATVYSGTYPAGGAITDSGVGDNVTASYTVTAVDAATPAVHSAAGVASATTAPGAPVLTATAKSGTAGEIDLSWPTSAGAATCVLTATNPSVRTVFSGACAAGGSAPDVGLADHFTVNYQLVVKNGAGVAAPTAPASATTATAKPSGFTVQPKDGGNGELDLAWTGPTGAAQYKIWRDAGASPAGAATFTQPGTTLNDTGQGDHASHGYVVAAVDANGTLSPFTALVSATTAPAMPVVTATAPDGVNRRIDLGWPAAAGASTFSVFAGARQVPWTSGNSVSDTDASLGDNQVVNYQVTAVDSNGIHSAPGAASGTTQPAVPTLQTAAPPQGPGVAGEIDLSWTASAGATGYLVQRSPAGANTFATITPTSTGATSARDTASLAASTSYDYRVQAAAPQGHSAFSALKTGTTTPPQVTGLGATASSSTQIDLSWNAVAVPGGTAINYLVFRSASANAAATGSLVKTMAGPGTTPVTYSDTALSPSTKYYYAVIAYDTTHTLDAPVSADANATTQSAAAGVLSASPQQNQLSVVLTWGSTGATSYAIQRAPTPTGGPCPTYPTNYSGVPGAGSLGSAAVTFTDNDAALLAGHSYCYILLATGSTQNTPLVLLAAPAATVIATVQNADGLSVHLAWSFAGGAPVGTDALNIYACSIAGGGSCTPTSASRLVTTVAVTVPASGTFDDGGRQPSTTYSYIALGTNASGSVAGAPAPVTSGPAVPGSPGAVASGDGVSDSVTVSWSAVSDGTPISYLVFRGTTTNVYPDFGAGAGTATAGNCSAGSCSFTDSGAGVLPGKTYHYAVAAVSTRGAAGTFTSAKTTDLPAVTPMATPVLTLTPKSGTAGEIDLSWTSVTGASTYRVWRDAGSPPVGGPTYSQAGTTKNDIGLAVAASHQYVVAPVDLIGNQGPYSVAKTASTAPGQPAPTAAATDGVNGQLVVSWSATAGASNYTVTRVGAGSPFYSNAAAGPATDTGLADNTVYTYQVVATDVAGTASPTGSAVATTVPAVPTLSASAPQSPPAAGEIDLSWSTSTGSNSYEVQRSPTGAGTFSPIGSPAGTSLNDTSVPLPTSPSTGFDYRVRASSANGHSAYSGVKTAFTTPPQVALGTPANATPTSLDLSWPAVAVPGGTTISYRVFRSTAPGVSTTGAPALTVAGPGSGTIAATDTGLSPNTPYYYVVVARDVTAAHTPPTVDAPASAEKTASTLAAAAPSLTSATPSATLLKVDLAWNPAGGSTAQLISRFDATGSSCPATYTGPTNGIGNGWVVPTNAGSLGGSVNTFSDTDVAAGQALAAGHVYCYAVVPTGAGTTFSNVRSALLAAPQPAFLTATTQPGTGSHGLTIQVAWDFGGGSAPPGTASLAFYRCSSPGTAVCAPSVGTPINTVATPAATGNFPDSGLTPSTTYAYLAVASNTTGSTGGAPNAHATTGPSAPQGAAAQASVIAGPKNIITVTWTAVNDGTAPDGYKVFRGPSVGTYNDFVGGTPVAQSACLGGSPFTCTFVDNNGGAGLPDGTGYHYVVEALSGAFVSAFSNDAPAATQSANPSNLTAVASNPSQVRQIGLNWGPATGAASYDIYRSTTSPVSLVGGNLSAARTAVSSTSFTDNEGGAGLTAATIYYYKVTIHGNAGSVSNEANALTAPAAPTLGALSVVDGGNPNGVGCTPGQMCVTIPWTPPAQAASYNVYRRIGANGFAAIATNLGPGTTSYTDATAASDTSYDYAVEAVNSGGAGPQAVGSATTLPASFNTLAATPSTDATSAATAQRITLTWTLPGNSTATGVWIYRVVSGGSFNYASPIATNASSPYVDGAVLPDTKYDYVARPGINGVGVSATNSNQEVNKLTLPAAPALVFSTTTSTITADCTAALTPSCIVLTWPQLPADVTGYQVFASSDNVNYAPASGTLACSAGTCKFVEGGLSPSTIRYYKASATNATGTGPQSTPALHTSTPPSAPGSLTATGGRGQVVLSWFNSTGATQYKVQRRLTVTGGAFGSPVIVSSSPCTDAGAGAGSCSLGALVDGQTYDYQVTAQLVTGSGTIDGGVATASPPGQLYPATPTAIVPSRSAAGTVRLSWTSSNCATSYDLLQASGSAGVPTPPAQGSFLLVGTLNTSGSNPCTAGGSGQVGEFKDIASLADGSTYWYQVTARNTGAAGDLATASTLPTPLQFTLTPAPPTGLLATAAIGQIGLSWNTSAGATSYNLYRDSGSGPVLITPTQNVGAGTVTATDTTGMIDGNSYTYTVTAVDVPGAGLGGGESAASNPSTATFSNSLPAPTGAFAVGLNTGARVLWNPTGGATSYKVYQRVASGNPTGEAQVTCSPASGGSSTPRSCVVGGLTNGTTYYFAVRASDGVHPDSADSNEAHASPARELCVSLPDMSTVVAIDADAAVGTEVVPRRWFGNVTQLAGPIGVAVDQGRDEIFVANQLADSITVYGPRASAAGNTAPLRAISGLNTTLLAPAAIAVDSTAADSSLHEVFVANGQSLLVFNATDSGAAAPKRQLTDAAGAIKGVALGPASNELTVTDGSNVVVYPRTWTGSPSSLRSFQPMIGGVAQTGLGAVAIDPASPAGNNEIWVASGQKVIAIDGGSGTLKRAFITVNFKNVLSLAYDLNGGTPEVIVGTVKSELQGYPRLSGDTIGDLQPTPDYSLSASGTPASLLSQPSGIAIDGSNVVVANFAGQAPFQQGVATYRRGANDGDSIAALIRELDGPFQASGPGSIATDAPFGLSATAVATDQLWVANKGTPGGSSSSSASTDNVYAMTDALLTQSPTSLALANGSGKQGNGIAVNAANNEVYVSFSTTTVGTFSASAGGSTTGTAVSGLSGAGGIFWDPTGSTLYVAEKTAAGTGGGTGKVSLWIRAASGTFSAGTTPATGADVKSPVGVWLATPSGGGATKLWVANSATVSGQLGPGAARFDGATLAFEQLYSAGSAALTPTAIIADQNHVYLGISGSTSISIKGVQLLGNVFTGTPTLTGTVQISGVTHAVGGLAFCN